MMKSEYEAIRKRSRAPTCESAQLHAKSDLPACVRVHVSTCARARAIAHAKWKGLAYILFGFDVQAYVDEW